MSFIWGFWTSGSSFTGRLACWPLEPGSVRISSGDKVLTDDGLGALSGSGTGTVDYSYGVIQIDFTVPLPSSGTPIYANYEPVEGGCYEQCGKCATNKLRLDLTPGAITGQDQLTITEAWARLIAKIERDVLPAHVELILDTFEEDFVWSIGYHFDIIEVDSIPLETGLRLEFDSTAW